ncbi:MAG: cell division protein SepF [Clostridia bacterium]|nr:cell division protein SepF [Clostridia bacterium]
MGFMNKVKGLFNVDEDEFYDDDERDEDYEEQPQPEVRSSYTSRQIRSESNVVDMRSASAAPAKSQVSFKKLERYGDANQVADDLNAKKIVILNLENCPDDASQRIIDFLSGVAYANDGAIKRIAGRAYIITPNNVPLTGEVLDEMGEMNF